MVNLNIQLPEGFLQEEERDGYVVSAQMKELWAVQLDLLNELDRVCKKHNLKYVLDFGTLLGAIRHKGYIPWDDDVDVSMLREDYDKLMEVAPQEFKEPYFMQTFDTDKGCDESVAKLRRSDTTCLLTHNVRHAVKYNQGIFLDIFVFDYLPTNEKAVVSKINQDSWDMLFHFFVLCHRPGLHDGIKYPLMVMRYLYYYLRYGSYKQVHRKLENFARQFKSLDYVGEIMYAVTTCLPKKWFEEIERVSFEHLMLPVPAAYDAMLTQRFGDYMTPVQSKSGHSIVYFDTSRSYKEIIKDKVLIKRLRRKIY